MRLKNYQRTLIAEAVKMQDTKAITELIEEIIYCMDHDIYLDRAFDRVFNKK